MTTFAEFCNNLSLHSTVIHRPTQVVSDNDYLQHEELCQRFHINEIDNPHHLDVMLPLTSAAPTQSIVLLSGLNCLQCGTGH